MILVQMIQANWLIFVAVLVVAILLALWLFGRAGKPSVRDRRPDILDEGAAPAQRNQALIDSPPAATLTPSPLVPPVEVMVPVLAPREVAAAAPTPAAGTLAGIGEIIAHGAQAQVEAAPEFGPEPAPAGEAPATAPSSGEADDLRRIKGLGPKLVATLHALGITRYAQIAGWTDADLDDLDTKLGAFAGRPRRDAWVEQAQLLSGGDTAAYEAKFGKL